MIITKIVVLGAKHGSITSKSNQIFRMNYLIISAKTMNTKKFDGKCHF